VLLDDFSYKIEFVMTHFSLDNGCRRTFKFVQNIVEKCIFLFIWILKSFVIRHLEITLLLMLQERQRHIRKAWTSPDN